MKAHSHFTSWNVITIMLLVGFVSQLLFLPTVSAFLGTYTQNSCVNVVTILNGTSNVNLSIYYPNNSQAINALMVQSGSRFTYNFCNTSALGTYNYDYADSLGNVYVNSFEVTGNGKPNASGAVIVLFALIFIVVAGSICWLAIASLGHLLNLDFDILDFAKNFGVYVVIVVLYFLEQFYVGNPTMDNFLLMIVKFGWILFILIPSIALILSLTVGTLQKKKMNVRLPQQNRRKMT